MFKSIFLFALLVGFAAGQEPPPFGTVIEQWSLQMSGGYAGSGMTWRRDEGRFYLMDQGYSGQFRVWKLDPADPPATIESVPWTFANLGAASTDIPWGIAWDIDSACFWTSHILDGSVYAGCYLLRYVWNGTGWVWGGTARDSWLVGNGSNGGGLGCFWLAGFEKWPGLGQYFGVPVVALPNPRWVRRFDPYTKVRFDDLALSTLGRGLALVPWDSAYILTNVWPDSLGLCKFDTTGRLLQSVPGLRGPTDMSVMWPVPVNPDDTVCVYDLSCNSHNTFRRISTGMLWWQLGSAVGVREEEPTAHSRPPTATVCRGSLALPRTLEPWTPRTLASITGRKVMDLAPGDNDIRRIAPGVYFVRSADSDTRSPVRKVVIQR